MIRAALTLSLLPLCLAACATAPKADGGAVADSKAGPASAGQRAAAAEMEPLARATFWSVEYERDPADRQAALEFSRALRAIGSADKAGAIAQDAVQRHPDDAELLLALAAARLDEGRAPAAIPALEHMAEVAPSDWRAYSLLGVALDQSGKYGEARGRYAQALQLSPDNAAVLTNLGMSYMLSGDAARAEDTLRQAVVLPGAPAKARQNLALALAYQGKFDEAKHYALIDLPANVAQNNIDYAKSLMTRQRSWDDLRR